MSVFLSDSEIISLYFERSESAISSTDLKYGRLFRRIAFSLLENEEDAEECVNDAYMRLWNAIPPERPSSLKAYGSKTVRNVSVNRAEYNGAQKRKIKELCEELADAVPDSDTDIENLELKKLINGFLRDLDKESRVIFVLRYFYGESMSEIAEKTSCSETKVRTRLLRTRKKLKKLLEKEGFSL